MPVSAARRRTAGDSVAVEEVEGRTSEVRRAEAAAADGEMGAGAATGAAAAVSMLATTSPIFTSAPVPAFRVMTPAASATPSDVILSVSSSKRGWSFLTVSPFLTCHLASTPELMDSPRGGILTSRRDMGRRS
jgi:hypothetical protein